MRKNIIMIGAGMMLALASCDKTEIREITEDRVVPQPVDTIKVADHFYLDGHLSRTAEDLGGRPLDAANLFHDGEELYVANFAGKCVDVFDAETLEFKRSRATVTARWHAMFMLKATISLWLPAKIRRYRSSTGKRANISAAWAQVPGQPA